MKATPLRAIAPKRQTTAYVKLKGVDMSADPSQIGEDFSPWCPNLISDNGGNPEKRPGWRVMHTIDGTVNGLWHGRIGSDLYYFAHSGTKFYAWRPNAAAPSIGTEMTDGLPPGNTPLMVCDKLNDARGSGFVMNERFWLLTGKEYVAYGLFDNKETPPKKKMMCKNVTEFAYVPTVIIARAPAGGGTPYENINLLGKQQKNSFLTNGTLVYQLSATKIKSVDKVMLKDVEKKITTDYTVDLEKGTVTLKTAPPAPVPVGKDDLLITFTKEYEGYADRIQKCTVAVGYGYGTNDRIFFTGNPEKRNTDWFSGLNDPSYIADLNYSKVGSEQTAIMGYHRLGEFLAVIKDEPLFLSRTGIYAITSNVITAERTIRGRSYFVDARLTKEAHLDKALAVEWNGYYVLTVNNRAYILDGNSTKENTRQFSSDYSYRCYHWDNIPATALMEDAGVLWFGTASGQICRFNTDLPKMNRFADDDLTDLNKKNAIIAQWATKADDDGDFMTRKTLVKKGSGVMIRPYTRSSVRVLMRSDEDCLAKLVKYSAMDVWNWEDVDFSRESRDCSTPKNLSRDA